MFGATQVIGAMMLRRLWAVAHVGLTITCLGCSVYLLWRERGRERGTDQRPVQGDFALRRFHQVRWLGGDYELPPGRDHCGVAVLTFEDGRFTGRRRPWVWSIPPGGPRAVPYLVMWGPTPAGPRVLTFNGPLTSSSSGEKDDLFAKLDGSLMRCFGPTDEGELRGYRVIGYAGSSEVRAGQDQFANVGGNLDLLLRSRRYVAVLGIKAFDSETEAQLWASQPTEDAAP